MIEPCCRAGDRAIDDFAPNALLDSHRHREANAALILDGDFLERSLDGRYTCARGVILVHPAYHLHANEFSRSGAQVLTLHLERRVADDIGYKVVTTSAADEFAQLIFDAPAKAAEAIVEESRLHRPIAPPPWLPRFIALMLSDRSITEAAADSGVSVEHASRTTSRWFGDSPRQLRREGKLQRAIAALRAGAAPAEAAAEGGFADQPHLTRALKRATGLTPGRLRKA